MREAPAERETDGNELSAETWLPWPQGSLRATETSGPSWYHENFPLDKELPSSCGKPLAPALCGRIGDMGHATQVAIFLFLNGVDKEDGFHDSPFLRMIQAALLVSALLENKNS